MWKFKKQKAQSEILSYSLVILIIIVVMGVLITVLFPQIAKQHSVENYKQAELYINKINSNIINVLAEPTGSTVKLQLNLDHLYLDLDSNNNKIIIYQIVEGDYFDKKKSTKFGNIHIYRDGSKLYTALEYNTVDITGNFSEQEGVTDLYFTKTGKNKVDGDMAIDGKVNCQIGSIKTLIDEVNYKRLRELLKVFEYDLDDFIDYIHENIPLDGD